MKVYPEHHYKVLIIVLLITIMFSVFLVAPSIAKADGPISYWKLDETTGPPYADLNSVSDGVCASGGCPVFTSTAQINSAQYFTGTAGVDISPNSAFDWGSDDSFSIELWMKGLPGQTCSTSNETIIGRTDGANNLLWHLGCSKSTGYAQFVLGDSSGSISLQSTKPITDGAWHHLLGIRDASSNLNRLYVDGMEVVSDTISYSGGFSSPAPLNIGYLNSNYHFKGIIDEVAIYDNTIATVELGAHYYLARDYTKICLSPVKIMPLGDSITKGSGTSPLTGYRQPLYIYLTSNGIDVDFVGSNQDGQSALPSFDTDHQGISSIQDDFVASNVFNWLMVNPADVVLLHIGTNDIDPDTLDLSPEDIETILDEIDRYSEQVTVILARIINRSTFSPETTQFNIDVSTMAQARIANGDKIIIADHENALVYPNDMSDLEHPNASGYDKMASTWFDILEDILPTCFTTEPTITSSPVTEATVGQPYTYDVEATGTPVPTYTLTAGPTGMVIDSSTGLISWTPVLSGSFDVSVLATNSHGSATQNFSITVASSISYNTVLIDQFNRPDNNAVGNNWIEFEDNSTQVALQNNKLCFVDTLDQSNRPLIQNTFQLVTTGHLAWTFDFDWFRSGSENDYRLFMQLGQGSTMNNTAQDAGIGVNLVWSKVNEVHEILAYRQNGQTTALSSLSGQAQISAVVNLDAHTYDLYLNNSLIQSQIPFDNLVDIDTVRFFTDGISNENFSGRCFDNLQISSTNQPKTPIITSTPDTEATVGLLYTYDVEATGSPVPTYTLTAGPTGMVIDSSTGLISWTPALSGSFDVSVLATNSQGSATQNFSITVASSISGSTVLIDQFNRPDNNAVGNNWIEFEDNSTQVALQNNKLCFVDTLDQSNRPLTQKSFQLVTTGYLVWTFDFDWFRSGSENDYRLFMQLGQGSTMSNTAQDTGIGVNLVWSKVNDVHEILAYRQNGLTTALSSLSGQAQISAVVNLDAHTYDLYLNNSLIQSQIPFDNLVDIDTVRFFTDGISNENFSGRCFDNLQISSTNQPKTPIITSVYLPIIVRPAE